METKISRKTKKRVAKLHPSEDRWSDRITNQLMFIPPNYEKTKSSGEHKTILLFNGLGPWNVKQGSVSFIFDHVNYVPTNLIHFQDVMYS